MHLLKSILCAGLFVFSLADVTPVIKTFMQGPHSNYLMNSSNLFLPTDYLSMNTPVIDARTVVINSGVIGGLDSAVSAGIESRAFRDSEDHDFFYQIWHFAHIDDSKKRTNVVTIIVSLGDINMSPSGDMDERGLLTSSGSDINKVYVQVYRTWSIPSIIPLTQENMDGWWHSITHAFHTAVHIWNEVKPWIGIARTVLPILVSLDDAQPGLGLKSVVYSPEPQSTTATSSNTASDKVFSYSLTPGEMAAVVICVFVSGAVAIIVIPKMWNKKWNVPQIVKMNKDVEARNSATQSLV
jgi:hypothetical protein